MLASAPTAAPSNTHSNSGPAREQSLVQLGVSDADHSPMLPESFRESEEKSKKLTKELTKNLDTLDTFQDKLNLEEKNLGAFFKEQVLNSDGKCNAVPTVIRARRRLETCNKMSKESTLKKQTGSTALFRLSGRRVFRARLALQVSMGFRVKLESPEPKGRAENLELSARWVSDQNSLKSSSCVMCKYDDHSLFSNPCLTWTFCISTGPTGPPGPRGSHGKPGQSGKAGK